MGHLQNGPKGAGKKNGHNFAPNMACFTLGIPMIRSAGGSRGSEGGSGRGAFKNTSKGGIKKMAIISPFTICRIKMYRGGSGTLGLADFAYSAWGIWAETRMKCIRF